MEPIAPERPVIETARMAYPSYQPTHRSRTTPVAPEMIMADSRGVHPRFMSGWTYGFWNVIQAKSTPAAMRKGRQRNGIGVEMKGTRRAPTTPRMKSVTRSDRQEAMGVEMLSKRPGGKQPRRQ